MKVYGLVVAWIRDANINQILNIAGSPGTALDFHNQLPVAHRQGIAWLVSNGGKMQDKLPTGPDSHCKFAITKKAAATDLEIKPSPSPAVIADIRHRHYGQSAKIRGHL